MKRPILAAAAAALLAHGDARAQATRYFQQGVDYRIEARLEEGTDVLHGRARLRYTNRSPATLDTLYVHQHLNAFRPNSAWARRELQFGVRRFQDLGPSEHAFERFTSVRVDGREVRPAYPGAPDSTVAALPLPAPLAPGGSVTVVMDWDARLSTLPRRQGRRGRHYDFAQWYPRIAVYDRTGWAYQPLLPQGEFYGEFAAYDVTLDLAADQVVGATGVPVEGSPGWTVSDFERGFYRAGPAEPLGLLTGDAGQGRKRVRFRADSVHHFAWAIDPGFRHEDVTRFAMREGGGRAGLPTLHVLFWPGDTATWGSHQAARTTYDALAWLQGMFGPYPWPQLTNLHRLESGGTEFPMLVMNGSANRGLIVHEVTHQYLHGILANNEWREGWMDEGFTSFVEDWFTEDLTRDSLRAALPALSPAAREDSVAAIVWGSTMRTLERLERADSVQPIALPGAAYATPRLYTSMTYTKASAVFRMLRDLVGEDAFRRILREFYRQYRLKHVTGADFQRVAEEVGRRDLDWFFGQWIERTDGLDYGVASAVTRPAGGGRWRTRVVVQRTGAAWMPVEVKVGEVRRRLESRARRQSVEVVTREKPAEVVLDPRWVLIDPDRSNNTFRLP
jgi:peptidase M1-like protein